MDPQTTDPKPRVHFDGLSVGRIVHFVPAGLGYQDKPCRAALVVRTWEQDKANLAVFLDGSNDGIQVGGLNSSDAIPPVWRTSVPHDAIEGRPLTFHSPTACPFE